MVSKEYSHRVLWQTLDCCPVVLPTLPSCSQKLPLIMDMENARLLFSQAFLQIG